MSLLYIPISELDAVNQILATVGESPVSTLDTSAVSVASLAQKRLHGVSRFVQSLGLDCNSESDYPLSIDEDGYIFLPTNALKVDPVDKTKQCVQRGNPAQLYDKKNHTFIFTETVDVDIVFFLPFEELPQVVRNYIAVKATREFQARWLSSEILHKLTENDEKEAWANLFEEEMMSADCSIFDDSDLSYIVNRY